MDDKGLVTRTPQYYQTTETNFNQPTEQDTWIWVHG